MSTDAGRIVVVTSEDARCSLQVGDYVEFEGSRITLPAGARFCRHALMAAIPVLGEFQQDLPADHWLARKPYVWCADAQENVVLKLCRSEESS